MPDALESVPAAPRVTATGLPAGTTNLQTKTPFSSVQVDGARATRGPPPPTSRTFPMVRTVSPRPGHADARNPTSTATSPPSERSRRTRSALVAEVERVVDDQPSIAGVPCRFEHERSRVIATRDDGRPCARRSDVEFAAPLAVEDREEHRCRVDARPAEPRDVAVRIDEGRGPRIREQRVRADRMLHPVSLEDGRDPCGDRAKRAAARGTCPRDLLSRTLVRSLRSGFRPGDGAELKNSIPHFVRSVKDFVGECGRSGKTSSLRSSVTSSLLEDSITLRRSDFVW